MPVILGIDPGSLKTGFGVIDARGGKLSYVASGIIKLPAASLPEKLRIIAAGVAEIIAAHRPVEMAVEEVFFARDPRAALKLGQARGAAIVAGVQAGLAVAEYSAKTVKLSVVGTGAATKEQVSHMVVRLLNLDAAPREDAADALAVALCHAHSLRTAISLATKVAGVGQGVAKSRYARGRLKEIQHR
ncbi:MAG: crossover junction endodeoxyribonuclease RuvC [Porticoccaceae bacterium]|jgi:crossover junction endodeoxyribonuclease RuvC|nr:crossover junction endodeoxyribonuclease RuvC [Porticoccaceae bacterium]MEA3299227.1 crossover junction endodeoxyribonuclease RuvC [Pseudomonadota bacterium]HLS98848.1 crossover junction endodeoxyribonuclease RuvC [Porticoccaceae bacterium]